ncbi:MAG: hypothetical protein JOZ81_34745 [Chloroflexi bacterium]|nr:hypothetical protein [Chloroflexota bacterium]
MPELVELEHAAMPEITSVSLGVVADDELVDALSAASGLSGEDVLPALSALGVACWSAHQTDEHAGDGDEDDIDDDDGF